VLITAGMGRALVGDPQGLWGSKMGE
jgi:hypothetical protein